MIAQRIKELEEKHGGLSVVARVINVDKAYLWRLKKGQKSNPSAKLLKKLGLKRIVTVTFENV